MAATGNEFLDVDRLDPSVLRFIAIDPEKVLADCVKTQVADIADLKKSNHNLRQQLDQQLKKEQELTHCIQQLQAVITKQAVDNKKLSSQCAIASARSYAKDLEIEQLRRELITAQRDLKAAQAAEPPAQAFQLPSSPIPPFSRGANTGFNPALFGAPLAVQQPAAGHNSGPASLPFSPGSF